jgi:hypothetical protein
VVLNLDELSLTDLRDPRLQLVIRMLTRSVYREAKVSAILEAAGLNPGDYSLSSARMAWTEAAPDAARQGKLGQLVACVIEEDRAFGPELERKMRPLLLLPGGGRTWYRCDDPFACGFVGAGAGRAVIDRQELRQGLQDLVAEEYRVLIVTGEPGAGKSHSWLLIDHLRQAADMMASHRFVRVTTHFWAGEVSGEDLALSLAARLGLDISLTPSSELDDARIRKILDMIVGRYPYDGVTRWIVLDGLDRPLVQETARDVARQLITLVSDSDLPKTRLIITGFDTLGFVADGSYQVEQIPSIDETQVSTFLATVASHLGCRTSPAELAALVAEVVEAGGNPRCLREVERAVVQLVKKRWAEGPGDDGW